MSADVKLPIAIGEVVAGKFRIDRVLGRGGSGTVVLATHLQLDERVALKFIEGEGSDQIADNARATVKLKSDCIARVLDIGKHHAMPYVVMEYLEGEDLESIVRDSGPLQDVGEAVELVLQACEAVAEAHRAGIIHRDIKLANIFLVTTRTGLPRIKLLDFGVARNVAAAEGVGAMVGTPHYMAPERLLGIDDDPRSDIWSLGVALFELVSGHKPFVSDNTVALIAEILEKEHTSLAVAREGTTDRFRVVVDRCLSKDPETRYQSAGELASALAPFAPVRAQVHVERALEYGRPPPPPSSTPAIESARRTLAHSSRALRASRASTTSGSSSTRSLAAAAAPKSKFRPLSVIGWATGVLLLLLGGLLFAVVRARPPTPYAGAPEAGPRSPTQGWTVVPTTAGSPPPHANAPTTASAAGTHPGLRPVMGSQPPRPVPPAAPATPSVVRPALADPPATATATTPARPTLEVDPWKANPDKPKMDDFH